MSLHPSHRHIQPFILNGRRLDLHNEDTPNTRRPFELTPREKEVMAYILQGKTSWEIGKILDISQSGVRKHLASIYRTFRTNNKLSAAIAYLCHEMLVEQIAAKLTKDTGRHI